MDESVNMAFVVEQVKCVDHIAAASSQLADRKKTIEKGAINLCQNYVSIYRILAKQF